MVMMMVMMTKTMMVMEVVVMAGALVITKTEDPIKLICFDDRPGNDQLLFKFVSLMELKFLSSDGSPFLLNYAHLKSIFKFHQNFQIYLKFI